MKLNVKHEATVIYYLNIYFSRFEKELKNKLSLKSSGHTSEETVLLKAFKYFDLDNSGT